MKIQFSAFERPAVKLVAFACTLGVTLGGAALIGATVGPEPSKSPAHGHGSAESSDPAGTDAPETTTGQGHGDH